MPVLTESSTTTTVGEHIKWRKPRSQFPQPISETDPMVQTSSSSSIIQSTGCKSTISSLILSSFTTTTATTNEPSPSPTTTTLTIKKKTNFPSSTFRGLGCTASASQQVSVPAVIRSSANWQGKKAKKKKQKKNIATKDNDKNEYQDTYGGGVPDGPTFGLNSATCMDFQDVWCAPGIGFSAETTAGSVDCVVARRNVSGRGKIDADNKMSTHRERPCLVRRAVSPETVSFLDSEPDFPTSRPGSEVFGGRYYRHVRHPSPDGLAEILLFQSSLMMGGRLDKFRDWRLDVDRMSYEELLELGDRIGYVSTGLKEVELSACLQKVKPSISSSSGQVDKKCIICQEEYEADDEMGRLHCGHNFHLQCIKQWLAQKNTCPFCKVEAISRC